MQARAVMLKAPLPKPYLRAPIRLDPFSLELFFDIEVDPLRRVGAGIYYYSKYERTIYRKLQEKYPDVCTPEDIEQLFDPRRAIDLYGDVVLKATEWPTRDHSIKTIARYLGFGWRDTHPSGAASVEWFDRWCRERDPMIKERILAYNEDDCRATRILLDGIRALAD
ncbi:TM0106 family RecB-like putative nuclease [Bradyrhizobium sp. STM 3562]|uniref:TM0106 family RecB-like putative nuclease n=1 Tax=Bradyrhizobium sp. STM 3562 TaxID=578924 RepID=UPI00389086F0